MWGCSGRLAPWTVPMPVVVLAEPYPLGHHGGHGTADLVVADVRAVGAQDHEEEADGKGHIEDTVQRHRGLEAHKGQRGLLQKGCTAWGEDGMGVTGGSSTGMWGHMSTETWGQQGIETG